MAMFKQLLDDVFTRVCKTDDKVREEIFYSICTQNMNYNFQIITDMAMVYNTHGVLNNALKHHDNDDEKTIFQYCIRYHDLKLLIHIGDLYHAQGHEFLKEALYADNHCVLENLIGDVHNIPSHRGGDDALDAIKCVVQLYRHFDSHCLSESLISINDNLRHYYMDGETNPTIKEYLISLYQECGIHPSFVNIENTEPFIQNVKVLDKAPDCVVCHEKGSASHAFAPCGHVCICFTCASSSPQVSACPLCRAKGTPFAIRGAEVD